MGVRRRGNVPMSIHAAASEAGPRPASARHASAASARTALDPRLAPGALLKACGLDLPEIMHLFASVDAPAEAIDIARASGRISEQRILAVLAGRLSAEIARIAPPPQEPRASLLQRRHYSSILPDGRRVMVIAPDGAMAAHLFARPQLGGHSAICLVTRQAYLDAVLAAGASEIAEAAAFSVPADLSARSEGPAKRSMAAILALVMVAALFVAALAFAPQETLLLLPIFTLGAAVVITALVASLGAEREPPALTRSDLPRYSVLVPLYREANMLPRLVQRLSALDYPRERLEVLLLVEADDAETQRAIAAAALPAFMAMLIVPPGTPRTKPRALNVGLMAASGELIVVFDAEDAPEPDQLRRAAAIFARAPDKVACVQARLAIENMRDNWLTRRFAVEYAALFDCGKSGMARLGWPVPLGGTSNHFRAEILRRVGAWDAWNVTEDADLGLRLARSGYLVRDLPSTTWEEAPNRLGAWMNQRTRWMKGWMQTILVHARSPLALMAELGTPQALVMSGLALSVVLGALLLPFFSAGLAWRIVNGGAPFSGPLLIAIADAAILEAIILATATEIIPAALALHRRGALRALPWVLLAPISCLMVSIAAWRGLFDLVRQPHFWHKTRHGQSRSEGGLGVLRQVQTPRAR